MGKIWENRFQARCCATLKKCPFVVVKCGVANKTPSKIRFPAPMSGAGGLLWDGWTNQAVWAEFVAKEANEDLVRMHALCAERGIPEGPRMYYQLALALAREAYPAKKVSGRKKIWDDLTLGALVVAVEQTIKASRSKKPVTWACAVLARSDPWKTFCVDRQFEDGALVSDVLHTRYKGFKASPRANLMRDAFALHEMQGRIDEWDEFVADLLKHPRAEKT